MFLYVTKSDCPVSHTIYGTVSRFALLRNGHLES